MSRLTKGLVQVYTGDGKGKTTAALGLALRAAGRGLRVCFIMFLKGDADLGEVHAAARLGAGFEVRQFGASREQLSRRSEGEWWNAPLAEDDRRMAVAGLDFARRVVLSGEFDVVVLDEINVAITAGLLDVGEVLSLLRGRPKHVEVVLTGRRAPPPIVEMADLVTEMREIKHPLQRGDAARPGIEY